MKPNNIMDVDWELLKSKYPNNLDEVIEKIKTDNESLQEKQIASMNRFAQKQK